MTDKDQLLRAHLRTGIEKKKNENKAPDYNVAIPVGRRGSNAPKAKLLVLQLAVVQKAGQQVVLRFVSRYSYPFAPIAECSSGDRSAKQKRERIAFSFCFGDP